MREAFKFSKTTVSMRLAELKPADIGIHNAPKNRKDETVATQWQIIYSNDGKESVHTAFETESEADAAMDDIKSQADASW